ncbi:serine hydrolase domain-containing protein [Plantibacter sp. YIM 135347]|uniref:serine hydrolase domain-containing protein n=1 Tax=Plantibacter sp. YIM 135347 TaxID=3423919 RepID=UPI003D33E1EE
MSRPLLPRSAPRRAGVSSAAIGALLDRLEEKSIECHSMMIVRNGYVVAEGWWAPYSAERPHQLYSLTKTFTSMAVGMAIGDGLLSLDDRVVDVLPDHLPEALSEQARLLNVHHLLSMTTGHRSDTLAEAWQLVPNDLVKGFLSVSPIEVQGAEHIYDNSTAFVLARMVERVTGVSLPELLDARLFVPMGIEHAEWDRVGSGAAFGFHGLHLRTEAVAAFGELLRQGGVWDGRQLVPRDWVELTTRTHAESSHYSEGEDGADFLLGYGYQIWMARHGFHGNGAFGQHCVVVPEQDLVVVVTSAQREVQQAQDVLDAIWECLLPGMDRMGSLQDDEALADRLGALALPLPEGSLGPKRTVTAVLDASIEGSALAHGTTVTVDAVDGGWRVQLDSLLDTGIAIGYGEWRESHPLGRAVCAAGAWRESVFLAEISVITSPHRVRLELDAKAGMATLIWVTVPLTTADLVLHLRAPLMTRPEVA